MRMTNPDCRRFAPAVYVFLLLLVGVAPAPAATLTVTSPFDSGPGTLRQTIVNSQPGGTINFAPDISEVRLVAGGQLVIDKDLTIEGPGAHLLSIHRSDAPNTDGFRILATTSNIKVTISGVTISNGSGFTSGGNSVGGGILINSGTTLTLNACVISNNSAGVGGGGIYNQAGTLVVDHCTFSGNHAATLTAGGAIFNSSNGTVSISHSTISGRNSAPDGDGGGIYNAANGTVTIDSSTISGNDSAAGAGIFNQGTLSLTNSTISGNLADLSGGGIYNQSNGALTLIYTTIASNGAANSPDSAGGVINNNGLVQARNTIIAKNTGADFDGTLTSQGHNLIGNGSAATVAPAQTSDQIGTAASPIDPLLGPLTDNGGPTLTRALLHGSPAIDQGGAVPGVDVDQREARRPVRYSASIAEPASGDGSDIGAFEVSPIQFSAASSSVSEDAGSVSLLVTRSGDTSAAASVHYATTDGTATAGADYANASGDLVFAAGETEKSISITVVDDNLGEGNETFTATLSSPMGADLGLASAVVTIVDNEAGATPTPTASPAGKPLNLSTRGDVQTGDKVMIGGVIITGNSSKRVIVRALGPSLARFGLAPVLADPILELRGPNGSLIATNDNWRDDPDQAFQIQGSGLPPQDDLESAMVATLPAAGYTAIVRGKANGTGLGLVEIYDLDGNDSRLANISTRALVEPGSNVMIGGFIIGSAPADEEIIVRAIGPSLARLGVPEPLADPVLELRDSNGTLIGFNDDWRDNPNQEARISAAGLQPRDDAESAIAAQLPPGDYTVIVSGKSGNVGVGLVEVYGLP